MPLEVDAAMMGLVCVPLTAALLVFLTSTRAVAAWTMVTSAIQFGLATWLTYGVLHSGPLQYQIGSWTLPLGITLHADGISTLMIWMTSLVGGASTIYASGYLSALRRGSKLPVDARLVPAFWPLWLILWAALNALFLSGDLFNIYVTLEMVTLSAVALIGLAGRERALVAAMRYLIAAMTGSLLYLLGVGLMYAAYGTLAWDRLGGLVQADGPTLCAASLMTAGLLVKTALFPLHYWLPDAHANAPAPVSGVLSGLVLKGSFFIILRLWLYIFFPLLPIRAGQLLCGLGMAAILWGSCQAIRQQRVKQMIAYSTVAQIGYLFLIFGIWDGWETGLAWRGTGYFMLSHACAKAAAFMVAGSLMYAVGTDRLEDWAGIGRREPVLVFAFGLAGVSLMGLPPSGGFIAKWLLLNAAVAGGHWMPALVMIVGGLLAAVYVFRVIAVSFSDQESSQSIVPVPLALRWPPLLLALTMIVFGVLTTQPIRLLEIGTPTTAVAEVSP